MEPSKENNAKHTSLSVYSIYYTNQTHANIHI
jgi:hypothetical protein